MFYYRESQFTEMAFKIKKPGNSAGRMVLCMYDTTIEQWVNVVNVYSTGCHHRQQTQLATTLNYNYKKHQQ